MQTRISGWFLLILLACPLVVGCQTNSLAWRPWQTDSSRVMPALSLAGSTAAKPDRTTSTPPIASTPSPARSTSVPAEWIRHGSRDWNHIVIHHSATAGGNAAVFHQQHLARGWDGLGYHFVITNGNGGTDGQVQVGWRWNQQRHGAHTGGTPGNEYNEHGIGICLVGDFTDHLPTPAQLASLQKLVTYLSAEYDIAPEQVIPHRHAPNAHTECCGDQLVHYLDDSFRPKLEYQLAARP